MSFPNHALSKETTDLLEKVLQTDGLKLVLYSDTNWAIENVHGGGALGFNPTSDSEYLRDKLTWILARGRA